jgi:hypothetical protein
VSERGQPVEVGARTVGLREGVANLKDELALEGNQLALLSGENLFQAWTCG